MSIGAPLGRRLLDERAGSVGLMFGLAAIVLLLSIGLGVDTSRYYSVASRLQSGLDAASLAAAKQLDIEGMSDAAVAKVAQSYFDSHRDNLSVKNVTLSGFKAAIDRTKGSVVASVNVNLPTLFGKIGNIRPTIRFSLDSQSVYMSKKIELAMVLDITGSMCFPGAQPCTNGPKIDALRTAAKDLVDSLYVSVNGPGAIRVSLVPYSASVNAGAFAGAAAKSASMDSCVVERDGGQAYTDTGPSSSADKANVSSPTANKRYSCPSPTVVALTDLSDSDKRKAFKSSIEGMQPSGGTAGHIGAAWGWYTLSPNWSGVFGSANAGKPYHPDIVKAVILMTDGDFNTSYFNGAVNSLDVNAAGSSSNQARQLCSNMTAKGVQVYSVAFQAPPAAEALLQECAGKVNYYNADNQAQLIAAFRDIVDKLTSLRITE